jgi:hypothetical protein
MPYDVVVGNASIVGGIESWIRKCNTYTTLACKCYIALEGEGQLQATCKTNIHRVFKECRTGGCLTYAYIAHWQVA